eukprot:TRINITY_DN62535_c0_g1_i1.p1 TRINITY_DN62535_c0_g1~~TRINITY_DN62535_c0_g1_i1.p1  ORF type:complete len:403 (+),score=76.05 TRINITY_DN62535_c0_g1_i1:198-1406(+)
MSAVTAAEFPLVAGHETVLQLPRCQPRRLRANDSLESLLNGLPGGQELCSLLHARKIRCLGDLVFLPPWELRDWLLVPESEAEAITALAQTACAALPPASAWDLDPRSVEEHGNLPVKTSVPSPFPALGVAVGGDLSGIFMEVAGPGGVGKTQVCHHLASLVAAAGGEVFWLDTESTFSPARVLELLEAATYDEDELVNAGHEEQALASLGRIRRRTCQSLQELHDVASELWRRARAGHGFPALVIVDSVAAVARNEGDPSTANRSSYIPRRQAMLSGLAGIFKAIVATGVGGTCASEGLEDPCASQRPPPCVVVTNQVAGDPTTGTTRVALGHVWHHAISWRLVLSHHPPGDIRGHGSKERVSASGRRYLHVEKSPSVPPLVVEFEITSAGLRELGAGLLA